MLSDRFILMLSRTSNQLRGSELHTSAELHAKSCSAFFLLELQQKKVESIPLVLVQGEKLKDEKSKIVTV